MDVTHNLLSVTVFASDCATADAVATSMMVMGMEGAEELCTRHPEIKAFYIYQAEDGSTQTRYSFNFNL